MISAARLASLVLLVVGFASALDTYSVSRVAVNGGYEVGLSLNSVSQWQGSVSLQSLTFSAVGGQVQWYETPLEVTVGSLSTNLQNIVTSLNYTGARLTVFKMNPSSTLFVLIDNAYQPYVRFFGESPTSQTPFVCTAGSASPLTPSSTPTLQSSSSIYCTQSVNVVGTFTANISGSSSFAQTIVFDNSSVAVADVLTPLWTIAFSRLTEAVLADTQIRNVAESNSDRRSTNQQFVGAIYFLFVFAMLHVLVIIVALQTWVLSLRKYFKAFTPVVWFGIYVAVLIAFSFPLGLFAWLLVGTIYVFLAVVYLIAYCVIRRRTSHQEDTPVENIAIPGPGTKYELAVDVSSSGSGSAPRPTSRCSLALTERPIAFGPGQKWALGLATGLLLLSLLIGLLLFFVIWSSPDYRLVDRTTAQATIEFIPSELAKGIAVIYGYDRVAYTINVNPFFAWATNVCGDTYKKNLSESDKKSAIYTDFIEKYSIDMSIYSPSDYTQYPSVNDWFIRHLAPGVRPIALLANPAVMISPADCRTIVFSRVPPDQRIWLKGNSFNIDTLLYRTDVIDNTVFYQGSLMINRLAPQDYHRFHSPVSGQITHRWAVKGSLLSVGADAITSDNDAIYNQRVVTIIQSPEFGQVAFVGIGASCVGSVVSTRAVGDTVTKGDELGYFEFGGSTVAVMFQPNKVVFDDDILSVSKNAVEVYVHMGSRLGQAVA